MSLEVNPDFARFIELHGIPLRSEGEKKKLVLDAPCTKWDPKTHLCTIYDERPQICRDYLCGKASEE